MIPLGFRSENWQNLVNPPWEPTLNYTSSASRLSRERGEGTSTRVLEDGLISTKSGDDRTTCDCNANETDLMSSRNNESVDLQSGYFAFSIFSILRRGKFAKFEESFF